MMMMVMVMMMMVMVMTTIGGGDGDGKTEMVWGSCERVHTVLLIIDLWTRLVQVRRGQAQYIQYVHYHRILDGRKLVP